MSMQKVPTTATIDFPKWPTTSVQVPMAMLRLPNNGDNGLPKMANDKHASANSNSLPMGADYMSTSANNSLAKMFNDERDSHDDSGLAKDADNMYMPASVPASDDNNGILAQAAADKCESADNNCFPDGFNNECKPSADNTHPPAVMSGFKGKKATKKLGTMERGEASRKPTVPPVIFLVLVTIWNRNFSLNHIALSLLVG